MRVKKEYKTKQRDLILSCLRENKAQHITVDEIIEHLKAQGTPVGQTTVYRNLGKFVKDGIVLKYTNAEDMTSCYQYVEQSDGCVTHYHLVCIDCGQMVHLQCEYLDNLSTHISNEHQFNLDKFKTVLYGCCNICAAVKQKIL